MAKAGFIHDKLDIKFLVLYLMARVASSVDFSTLADLTFCDDGVEYFDFAAALAELVDTGHLELKDDKYSITEKGRRNGKICESSLAYSVRRKCDRNLAKVNGVLRRDAQVRAEILPRDGCTTASSKCFWKQKRKDNDTNANQRGNHVFPWQPRWSFLYAPYLSSSKCVLQ